ncbi:major facilitator superfamily domain-containing protein [Mrakia frigida]|uniref:MDR family MFS transporter n=1 Tax=Mrakia frigida TaxID=29902 RepID=UPI003FCBF934
MAVAAPSPLTAEMESTSTSSRAFPPPPSSTSTSPQHPVLPQSAARSNTISSPTSATTTLPQGPSSSPTPSSHDHLDSEEEVEVEVESGKKVKKKRKEIVLQDQTNLLPVKQVIIIYSGLSLSLFCCLIDQTIVSTALPQIGVVFQSSSTSIWVANAYLLTSTAFQPLYGRFSDIFGRKYMLMIALAIFFLGSLACALAQSMIQLIIFRALAGIGGGGILTSVMIIVSDVVSLKDRGKYQGITGGVVALSNSLGPLLGGVFTEKLTWRWCFWINLPLTFASALVVYFLLPLKQVSGSYKSKLKQVDYWGSIITLGGTISLLIPISWGGIQHPWASASVLVPLIIGFFSIGLFIFVEMKVRLPIIPMSIFHNMTVAGVMISTFLSGCIFYCQLYYIPQYLQVVLNVSALRSAVLLLSLIIPQTFFSFFSGYLVSATGEYRWNLLAGFAAWTVGLGLLCSLDEHSSLGQIVGYQVLAGVGAGSTFQTGLVAVQAAVPRSQMAVVTSTRNFVRLLGGTVALAIGSSLLQNTVRNGLLALSLPAEVISSITSEPTLIPTLSTLTSEQRTLALQAYVKGVQHVWYFCIPCAGLSFFFTAFFVKARELEPLSFLVRSTHAPFPIPFLLSLSRTYRFSQPRRRRRPEDQSERMGSVREGTETTREGDSRDSFDADVSRGREGGEASCGSSGRGGSRGEGDGVDGEGEEGGEELSLMAEVSL